MFSLFKLNGGSSVTVGTATIEGIEGPFQIVDAQGASHAAFGRLDVVSASALELQRRFPVLAKVDEAEMLDAARQVSEAENSEREGALKNTRLGKWLAGQKFTEWAGLAVALLTLLRS